MASARAARLSASVEKQKLKLELLRESRPKVESSPVSVVVHEDARVVCSLEQLCGELSRLYIGASRQNRIGTHARKSYRTVSYSLLKVFFFLLETGIAGCERLCLAKWHPKPRKTAKMAFFDIDDRLNNCTVYRSCTAAPKGRHETCGFLSLFSTLSFDISIQNSVQRWTSDIEGLFRGKPGKWLREAMSPPLSPSSRTPWLEFLVIFDFGIDGHLVRTLYKNSTKKLVKCETEVARLHKGSTQSCSGRLIPVHPFSPPALPKLENGYRYGLGSTFNRKSRQNLPHVVNLCEFLHRQGAKRPQVWSLFSSTLRGFPYHFPIEFPVQIFTADLGHGGEYADAWRRWYLTKWRKLSRKTPFRGYFLMVKVA